METKNYYEILGVSEKASAAEIASAKNVLAKQYHPDVNMKLGIDTTAQMQEILEAYRILSNPKKRASYDRKLQKRRPKMQTFDLGKSEDTVEDENNPTLITYWKTAGALYEIIEESTILFHRKDASGQLSALAVRALAHIIRLREAGIPERYWYPDIMNWIFFRWLQNRNYNISYLLTLYDEYEKKEMSTVDRLKIQNHSFRYQRALKKLIRHQK